jgi:hypothetical protein
MTDYVNLSALNGSERREIWAAIQAHDPALQKLLQQLGEIKQEMGGAIEIPRATYNKLLCQWRGADGRLTCATK